MPLLSEIKYETKIRELKDISPRSVLAMLRDVRVSIGKLKGNFVNAGLARMLQVVESGEYKMSGDVSTRIDLSSAKEVIETYRKYSEGGCQSCQNFERVVRNEDMDTFFYCEIREDPEQTPEKCGYGVGFSPITEEHYKNPCDSWKPRFSPKLEVLISEK